MYKIKGLSIAALSLFIFSGVKAQSTSDQLDIAIRSSWNKTDCQWLNLKGDVVSVLTEKAEFRQAYGEWTITNKKFAEYSIFNKNGNYLLKVGDRYRYVKKIEIFKYNFNNALISREIHENNYDSDWVQQFRNTNKGYSRAKIWYAAYQYDTQGRLKTINTTPFDNREIDGAKDIFRYQSDGSYTMTRYNDSGKEQISFEVTAGGKKETRRTDGITSIFIYDENGRRTLLNTSASAMGGSASEGSHYGYNDNGDVEVISADVKMTQDVKNRPWLKVNTNSGRVYYYEYQYDNHGNWVEKKEYSKYGGSKDAELTEWTVRTIVYQEDISMDGDAFFAEELKKTGQADDDAGVDLVASSNNPTELINLGNQYLEKAEKCYSEAKETNNDAKYQDLMAQCKTYRQLSIEPFEKAFSLCEDTSMKVEIAEKLKGLYFEMMRSGYPEYQSRPRYPELTDTFFEWLQSIVSYPGAETPLGSILAASGSSLKIRMLLELYPAGTFIPPTSFQPASRYASDNALTWDLRNNKFYILQTTAEKEEKKAQEQIEQILNQLLHDLKDAPAVTKGQESWRTSVTILFENGQITAQEGY